MNGMGFHKLDEINWRGLAIVLGAAFILWAGLGSLGIPEPWHTRILTLIGAIQSAVTYIMRGSKEEIPEPPAK
jgi:hypothetical protein